MKKLSSIIAEGNSPAKTLTKNQIEKYLEICEKSLCPEAIYVCKWMIDNYDEYVKLCTNASYNGIANYYANDANRGSELYKNIGMCKKRCKLLMIPTYLSEKDFNDILAIKVAPDEIYLDLTSEEGRNQIAKDYTALVHKIARQWVGKSNITYDDLVGRAYEGLVFAMNTYGKHGTGKKAELDIYDEEEMKKYKKMSFLSYASYCILNHIRGDIKGLSHIVKIPDSEQARIKKEKGFIPKSDSISGDKTIGKGKDGDGNKTVFDYVGTTDDSKTGLDKEDEDKLFKMFYDRLAQKFDKKTLDMFYDFYGLNGHEQKTNKELAKQYNVGASNITYYCWKILSYIKSDPQTFEMIKDLFDFIKECRHDRDAEDNEYDKTYSLSANKNNKTTFDVFESEY